MNEQRNSTGIPAEPSDHVLVLGGLSVGYGRTVVVRDVNVAIRRGGFVGLVGANGSGKSTLLKTILGIVPPLAGNIRFGASNGRSPVIGYVPQRDALDRIFLLSAFDVVLMGVFGRVSPGRRVKQAERAFALECMSQTGANHLARQQFSRLSGGELQRVLIARALASKPDLLLLDEPTAGIDSATSEAVLELLKDINARLGVSILLVTHDLSVVGDYVQEVIWLCDGRASQGRTEVLLPAMQAPRSGLRKAAT